MRFSEQDVREILSQDHLYYTADALGIEPTHVTAQQLIDHWKRYHSMMDVLTFNVVDEYGEGGGHNAA